MDELGRVGRVGRRIPATVRGHLLLAVEIAGFATE